MSQWFGERKLFMYFCVVIYHLCFFLSQKWFMLNIFIYLFSKHHYPFMVLPLLNSWNTVLLGFIGASTTTLESDVSFIMLWWVLLGMIGVSTVTSNWDEGCFFMPKQVLLSAIGLSTVTSNWAKVILALCFFDEHDIHKRSLPKGALGNMVPHIAWIPLPQSGQMWFPRMGSSGKWRPSPHRGIFAK